MQWFGVYFVKTRLHYIFLRLSGKNEAVTDKVNHKQAGIKCGDAGTASQGRSQFCEAKIDEIYF